MIEQFAAVLSTCGHVVAWKSDQVGCHIIQHGHSRHLIWFVFAAQLVRSRATEMQSQSQSRSQSTKLLSASPRSVCLQALVEVLGQEQVSAELRGQVANTLKGLQASNSQILQSLSARDRSALSDLTNH